MKSLFIKPFGKLLLPSKDRLIDVWREARAAFAPPTLSGDDARCAVRAAFDDLQSIGLEAFTKNHDPYWNIPLNEALPQPGVEYYLQRNHKPRNGRKEKSHEREDGFHKL